ncbi:MAG: hypothetical protein JSU92_09535 [Deltaproteobacteria bacterium]|nr:MAG: hypothetical protein JSU92_09535 [Deltaproteobacteria bacterium]
MRKRSFWVALIIILLVVFTAGYLLTRKEDVRVAPVVIEEEIEEEVVVGEEFRIPAMAAAAGVHCPIVDIVSPRDKALLLDLDDSNPEKKGYQIRVKAKTDAEEGRTVFLRINELGPISAAVKNGSAFFGEVDLMEGPNTLIATVTSESSCNGKSIPVRVVVDTMPPIIKILSPVDGAIISETEVVVAGEARDEGRKVTFVTVNGVRAELRGERFKAILTSQPPGPLEITATAGDKIGKLASHSIRVTISDKPFINITFPGKGEKFSASSLEIEGDFGNFPHPDRVKITVNGKPAEINLSNNEYSLNLTGLSDGRLEITAVATDGVLAAKATGDVILDTRAPSIRIDAPLNNEVFAVPTVLVSGSVNDPQPGSGIESVTVNGYEAAVFDGEFSFALGNLGPCFFNMEITAEAMDNAGNLAISETVIVTVDTEVPVVEIAYPQKGSCLSTPEVEVNVTAVEACSGINWVEVNGVPAAIEGGVFTAIIPGGACIDPLTITAVAADWAGNQGTSEPVAVTVDTEAPEVLIDYPEVGRDMSDLQPVRGRALDRCSGTALVTVNNQEAIYIPGTDGFNAQLEGLNEGPLQLTAQAVDQCGNQGTHTMSVDVVHCPWINIIAPGDGQDFNANEVELTGNFGCFPNPAAVRVTAQVGGGEAMPAIVTGENYAVLLTGLPQGIQILMVTAADGTREALDIVRIRVDIVPPEIRIAAPLAGAEFPSLDLEVPVEGTAMDATSGVNNIMVNDVEATGPPFAPGVDGRWTAVLRNQPEGRLTIQATATDEMGWIGSDYRDIILTYPPTLRGPCGTGPYGINNPDDGDICYDINGIDCCDPDNEIDFGVPEVGMLGIGSAINFRPGDKITLPINVNSGDGILLAMHILLDYDKEVLTNPRLLSSDRCLPEPFYPAGGSTSWYYNFRPDKPILITNHSGTREPTGQRNLGNITFTISPDATLGIYPIDMEIITLTAHNGVIETESGPALDHYNLEGIPCPGEVIVVP